MVKYNVSSKYVRSLFMVAFLIVSYLLAGCSFNLPFSSSNSSPLIQVIKSEQEPVKQTIFIDSVPVANCGGTGNAIYEYEKSHNLSYVAQLDGNIDIKSDGNASIPNLGELNVGREIASKYNLNYSQTDNVSRKLSLEASSGTKVIYKIRQYELWQKGQVVIVVNGNTIATYNYEFRNDFGIELMDSKQDSCSAAVSTTIPNPTPISVTPQPLAPTSVPTTTPTSPYFSINWQPFPFGYQPFMLTQWAYDDSTIAKWYGLGFLWFLVRLILTIVCVVIDIVITLGLGLFVLIASLFGTTVRNIVLGLVVLVVIAFVFLGIAGSSG